MISCFVIEQNGELPPELLICGNTMIIIIGRLCLEITVFNQKLFSSSVHVVKYRVQHIIVKTKAS